MMLEFGDDRPDIYYIPLVVNFSVVVKTHFPYTKPGNMALP